MKKNCAFEDQENREIAMSNAMTTANEESVRGEMPTMEKWYGFTPEAKPETVHSAYMLTRRSHEKGSTNKA